MGCYLAIKSDESEIHSKTRMDLSILHQMKGVSLQRLHPDDTTVITFSKWQNYRDREQINGCQRIRICAWDWGV